MPADISRRNNMQMVYEALIAIAGVTTLDQVRAALPLHPRSVDDALRALVRGGYVRVRYEIIEGARPPTDTRGRKKRGGARAAR